MSQSVTAHQQQALQLALLSSLRSTLKDASIFGASSLGGSVSPDLQGRLEPLDRYQSGLLLGSCASRLPPFRTGAVALRKHVGLPLHVSPLSDSRSQFQQSQLLQDSALWSHQSSLPQSVTSWEHASLSRANIEYTPLLRDAMARQASAVQLQLLLQSKLGRDRLLEGQLHGSGGVSPIQGDLLKRTGPKGAQGFQAVTPQVKDPTNKAPKTAGDPGIPPPSADIRRTLETLGSNLRKRTDPYIDCAALKLDTRERQGKRLDKARRGGIAEPFPVKVFRMLQETEEDGLTDVVSFLPHGRAFCVHDVDRFVADILPVYFSQSRWTSFTRQLNLWGFLRINSGPDSGGYYHELFLRGKPELCHYMKRVGVPTGLSDRRRKRTGVPTVAVVDPDFYQMQPIVIQHQH